MYLLLYHYRKVSWHIHLQIFQIKQLFTISKQNILVHMSRNYLILSTYLGCMHFHQLIYIPYMALMRNATSNVLCSWYNLRKLLCTYLPYRIFSLPGPNYQNRGNYKSVWIMITRTLTHTTTSQDEQVETILSQSVSVSEIWL